MTVLAVVWQCDYLFVLLVLGNFRSRFSLEPLVLGMQHHAQIVFVHFDAAMVQSFFDVVYILESLGSEQALAEDSEVDFIARPLSPAGCEFALLKVEPP